ncbi:NAD(P)-dependent dehydrogenase (short-subunit alcohol dehydrogenase family) [Rhodococcus sp. OK302]|nr:NAD(P)-dependent dehydrogenase (short-subunit alcohol dehydrogenase family) [Rhodococcus sp. OK302]
MTGSASGIGHATKSILENRGHRVVGVDIHNADVEVDLSTTVGRDSLCQKVSDLTEGRIDAVVAAAGVAHRTSQSVKVNYFGAISTLESLRPLLLSSEAPRAVVVASFAALMAYDIDLLDALSTGDEATASAIADRIARTKRAATIYASTKRAIAEWVRSASISAEWAGEGIPLNAVGPGVIFSPMTTPMMEDKRQWEQLLKAVPMPLTGRPGQPVSVAYLLAWLVSEENTNLTGQVMFIDSGADAVIRGARVFD